MENNIKQAKYVHGPEWDLHHDPSDGRFTTACTSDRAAAAYRQYLKFFYIENFLHEVDFETILSIMLVEYHCGC
jgi:hypothetical protein